MHRQMPKIPRITAAIFFLLTGSSVGQSTIQIGGKPQIRDFGWGEVFADWQASTPARGNSLKSTPINLGNGIEMVLQLETARGWDVTADQVGVGVRSGLPGDDDDRLDASEWLELSVFSISDPANSLKSLTVSKFGIGYLNDDPAGERAAISDGTDTMRLTDRSGELAIYGSNGNLSMLKPLSIDTIASWRVRVTALEDAAVPAGANIRLDEVEFEYVDIPEPSAFALIAGVLVSAVLLRRRRPAG